MNRTFYVCMFVWICSCSGSDDSSTQTSQGSVAFSGTVQGLNGTLVIQNNVGEKITLTQNGAFHFPTILSPNSNYELSIVEEPCPQHCTIDSMNGKVNMDGAIPLSIECDAKSWSLPQDISDSVSFSALESNSVDITMNRYGDTIVSWSQQDEDDLARLYKKEYRNRQWINPSSIDDYFSIDGGQVKNHSSHINASGESYIGWVQGDGVYDQAYIGQYIDGRWKYPSSIYDRMSVPGSNVMSESNAFVVRSNDVGDVVVVWVQESGGNRQVFQAIHKDGVWSFPGSLEDNISPNEAGSSITYVDLALNQNGDYVIVWEQSDGDNAQIYKAESRNGLFTSPTSLDDNISKSSTDAHFPKVAMDKNGSTIVVWQQYDATSGGEYQIFKSEYRDGSWSHPTSLTDNISANGLHAYHPSVAMNDLNHAIIAWKQEDSTTDAHYQIYKKEYKNDAWDAVTRISPSGTNTYIPKISIDEYDNAIITWKQESVDGSVIYHTMKSEYRAGHWTHPSSPTDQISPGSTNVVTADVVAKDCRMVMSWRQQNASGQYQVFMAEYR